MPWLILLAVLFASVARADPRFLYEIGDGTGASAWLQLRTPIPPTFLAPPGTAIIGVDVAEGPAHFGYLGLPYAVLAGENIPLASPLVVPFFHSDGQGNADAPPDLLTLLPAPSAKNSMITPFVLNPAFAGLDLWGADGAWSWTGTTIPFGDPTILHSLLMADTPSVGVSGYFPVTFSSQFDVTTGENGISLASANSTPGTCGDAQNFCSVTTDTYGRVTSQTQTPTHGLTLNRPIINAVGPSPHFLFNQQTEGGVFAVLTDGDVQVDLPALSTVNDGDSYFFKNYGGGTYTQTLHRNGIDSIDGASADKVLAGSATGMWLLALKQPGVGGVNTWIVTSVVYP